jgi:hypothetical protein
VLSIVPTNLHWKGDEPADGSCAHGGVLISLDDRVLIDNRGEQWCLGGAALMLLRTLARDQTKTSRVGKHLFPCSGHAIVVAEAGEVEFLGCGGGLDFIVRHGIGRIALQFDGGAEATVSFPEWKRAVLAFSDELRAFYTASAPKLPESEWADGFAAFQAEWKRRLNDARPTELRSSNFEVGR